MLGQPNPVHIPTSHLLENRPNIHPSTPRSPRWSLSLRVPHQDPIQPPSPHPYAPHAQPISFFSILSPAQHWVRSTNHLAPRYAISSIQIPNLIKILPVEAELFCANQPTDTLAFRRFRNTSKKSILFNKAKLV